LLQVETLRKDTDIDKDDFTLKSEDDFWLNTKEKYTSYYR